MEYEIYTKLTNKEIEEVLRPTELDIKKRLKMLWSCFKDLEGDKSFEEMKIKVKFTGFKYSFDLRNVIEGEVEEYHDTNNCKIRGCEKINIQDYWDELEARESLMKECIRELYDEGEQMEPIIRGHD